MAKSHAMNKHWNLRTNTFQTSKRAEAFLKELEVLCKKHKLHISHEDFHGAFILVDYEEGSWIDGAMLDFDNE